MDAWYKTKFQDLNKATSRHVESARSVREEITGYKKEVWEMFFPRMSFLRLSSYHLNFHSLKNKRM